MRVSRKAQGVTVGDVSASVDSVLRSPGQPLTASARAFFEPRFGQDLKDVRVHADRDAQRSAQEVNAQAYTVGSHVVFNAGRYMPDTPKGLQLLAHELTHTIQQSISSSCGIGLQRQPLPQEEIEMPAVFAADRRKRTWRQYARLLGEQDAARIRRDGTLSSDLRDELNAKLRFFEDQARTMYIREIKPALFEVLGRDGATGAMPRSTPKNPSLLSLDYNGPDVCGGQPCATDEEIDPDLSLASRTGRSELPHSALGQTFSAEVRIRIVELLEHDVDLACHPPTRRCKYARATLETFLRSGEIVEYRNYDGGPGPANLTALYVSLGSLALEMCLANPFGCAMSFGIAGSSSNGGFEGCGAVAGFGAGVTFRLPGGAKLLSSVIRYAERDIIVVETSRGPQAFYRSTGINSGKEGTWLPFDGSIDMPGGFLKERFTSGAGLLEGDPLFRYGTGELKGISEQLGKMALPTGQAVGTSYDVNLLLQKIGARNPLD
ncbi:MAG: DUF4157 domain-containing protein [Nitrospirota bacterium]|nr:DUF4157 domain-containing protein [Nitrospirota bacterium]